MNSNKSDRKLIIIVTLLLLAESFWLLHKMRVIEVSWLQSRKQNTGAKSAGFVMKSQKELRKRNHDSLVWEKSADNDTLFYQDSVLTLNQSSAVLYLNEKTELQLSENTLVTIEESEDESVDQIRLRFSKGNLKARNPFRDTNLIKEDWVMKVQKGSDINVRQTKSDEFEVEVSEGQVLLEGKDVKKEIFKNQILQVTKDKAVEITKDPDLALSVDLPKRTYTFADSESVKMNWNSEAKVIKLMRPGEEALDILVTSVKEKTFSVAPGSYTARIENEAGVVSKSVEFEVVKAPTIHLLYPLPRDRVPTKQEFAFLWSKSDLIKSYSLTYQNKELAKTESNIFKTNFDEESSGKWFVKGVDAEGFEIPSLYSNEVFFQNKLFEAPKLKDPKLRKPASKNKKKLRGKSSWLDLVFGSKAAYAAENLEYEIEFEWEGVEGADLYSIEISTSENFRETIVNKQVARTSFVWITPDLKKIYWRVAAGNKKGRMGVFSAPSELDLSKLKFTGNLADMDGISIKRRELAIPPPPIPTPEPEPAPVVEKPDVRELERRIQIAYKPTYLLSNITGEDQNKFKRSGAVAAAVNLEFEFPVSKSNAFIFELDYFKQSWKPTPLSEYVFQKNLDITETKFSLNFVSSKSKWSWGLATAQLIKPIRISFEEISIEQSTAYGVVVTRTDKAIDFFQNKSSLSYLYSAKVQRADLLLQFQKEFEMNTSFKPFWGFGAEFNFHFVGGYKGSTNKGFFLIGIDGL